ncbi:MAG TPA: CopD family protein [Stellaceae bacterium]|nr:CopD family protein [Stellaceae bacterium]
MNETAEIATAALIVHTIAAVVWVGGMFFAYLALRPAAVRLEPELRLMLWERTLARFFGWVLFAIALLLASGYAMVVGVFAGFAGIGLHVQLMQGIGWVMILLFLHLYFAPWRRLRAAIARRDWTEGGRQLAQIRWIVAINLVLGLVTVAIGSSGRYWG